MRTTTTINFRVCKESVGYTCPCGTCGKVLKRKAVAECTVNPWNKNEDGSPKSETEVYAQAYEKAKAEAAKLQDVPSICVQCADAPNRALLLRMAQTGLDYSMKALEPAEQSAMRTLYDRQQVDYNFPGRDEPTPAGHQSGYPLDPDFNTYRVTTKGRDRAAKLIAAGSAAA